MVIGLRATEKKLLSRTGLLTKPRRKSFYQEGGKLTQTTFFLKFTTPWKAGAICGWSMTLDNGQYRAGRTVLIAFHAHNARPLRKFLFNTTDPSLTTGEKPTLGSKNCRGWKVRPRPGNRRWPKTWPCPALTLAEATTAKRLAK